MNPLEASKELPFRVGFTGHSGHLTIEPLSPVERPNPIDSLPFVLPPAFPEETPETIEKYIKDKYLLPQLDTDEFSPEKVGRQWEFDWFDRAKILPEPSLPRTIVVPKWEAPFRRPKDQQEGRWEPKSIEIDVSELAAGAEDLGALPQITGPPKDFVRGSITNRPFRPGGLDGSLERTLPGDASSGKWVLEVLGGGHAQTIPPGFKQGLDLGNLKAHSSSWNVYKDQNEVKSTINTKLNNLSVQFDDLFKKAWEEDIADYLEDADANEEVSIKSESPPVDAEANKLEVAGDVTETGKSVLDEILSVASGGSTLRLDGERGSSGHEQTEAWAITGGSKEIVERFDELIPDMALTFPFQLDPFQKEAIYYLERGDSVFVAAHTSAGKTVVAEYAFALASKHCTRAVYTAPIKTISNQKYRDFCGKFDVGLLTGDVSLRPEASCLIMTTEILRSMLYRGADIIRDIEWVIFDEVHYVNDAERGVVWEEVIIMLPRHINFVLLSATVPNTIEFADWIGRTKQKKICVTGTAKRPVPLEHCLFYSGELYKVCENEQFVPQGFKVAKDVYKKNSSYAIGGTGVYGSSSAASDRSRNQWHDNYSQGKQPKGPQTPANVGTAQRNKNNNVGSNTMGQWRAEASVWLSLIKKLTTKSLLPVVIFCFSKTRCDKSADNLRGTDLTSSSEKSEIRVFCDKAFSRLKGSDRNLPQVVRIQSLLRRGIGVHHAGLLPIVKEVVEMLFCRGVVKVLFSTETFAMGVNAPARTVEDMLKRSFAEFHSQKKLPEKQQLLMLKRAQSKIPVECIKGEPAIEEYFEIYSKAEKYDKQITETVIQSQAAQKCLDPGRVVVVRSQKGNDHLLGVLVKKTLKNNITKYIVLVLTPELPSSVQNQLDKGRPSNEKGPGMQILIPKSKRAVEDAYFTTGTSRKGSGAVKIKLPHNGNAAGVNYEVREVLSKEFLCICNAKIQVNPVRLLEDVSAGAYSHTVQQLLSQKSGGTKYPPALDPVEDLKLKDIDLVEAYHKWSNLLQDMSQNKCHGCVKLDEHIELARQMKGYKDELKSLEYEMSDDALQQMPDFLGRIDVLKEIGCINSDLVVQIKGRVACEMNSGEELICTECLFENQLDDLEPEEAVAIMSAFVFQQKKTQEPFLTPKLFLAKRRLYDAALRLGKIQQELNLQIDPEGYAAENLKFGLVEVVYEWAKGTPFADICQLTDVPEGLIVRTIVRLDETCREFRSAAAIMGNSALYKKMETASNIIKRDIVFAASLYITGV
ncbi:unnamed protein product [Cuscuta campestris]|uniref:Helicase ATP-binding domain-containing protein n=1 Tax=Cuscuta campestris TaxID=132261 RepID=A0A484NCC0_9ASTE|nr:unnamed protein product [Cuscuta campestris]